jgi:hypothetical protein
MSGNAMHTVDYDPTEESQPGLPSYNDMSRWEHVQYLVKLGAQVVTMFDDDGISVRFLNNRHQANNVITANDVNGVFEIVRAPGGGTPIGRSITSSFDDYVRTKMMSKTLPKPVLFLIYTDGVSGDSITTAIRNVRSLTTSTEYGSKAVLFSLFQVGSDRSATEALKNLDEDEDKPPHSENGAGDITDCTSSYRIEKAEYDEAQKRKSLEERVEYTEFFHFLKGLIGPIMPKYDKADEAGGIPQTATGGRSIFGWATGR